MNLSELNRRSYSAPFRVLREEDAGEAEAPEEFTGAPLEILRVIVFRSIVHPNELLVTQDPGEFNFLKCLSDRSIQRVAEISGVTLREPWVSVVRVEGRTRFCTRCSPEASQSPLEALMRTALKMVARERSTPIRGLDDMALIPIPIEEVVRDEGMTELDRMFFLDLQKKLIAA